MISFLAGCTIFEVAPTSPSATISVATSTLNPPPTHTPTPTAMSAPSLTSTSTPDPCTGWWCAVTGVVYADAAESGNELEGASVTLYQSSYCSPTSGQYQATTGPDGAFEFGKVFFHDTDLIRIQIEFEGYEPALWKSNEFYCFYCSCFGSPVEIVLNTDPGQ